jgi:hypothetical protein
MQQMAEPVSANSSVSDAYLLSMRDALVRSLPALEELEQSQEDLRDFFTLMRMSAKNQLKGPIPAEERTNYEQLLGYINRLFTYFDTSTKVCKDIHRLGSIVRAVGREQTEG